MNVYLAQANESLTAGKTDWCSRFGSVLEASFPLRYAPRGVEDKVLPRFRLGRTTAAGWPSVSTRS